MGAPSNVCDSIQRVVFDGGDPVCVEVALGATAQVFLVGHRIRAQVTSSNYPRFDVNSGTGEGAFDRGRYVITTQQVFHDGTRPSRIVLPVVPCPLTTRG